MRKYSPSKNQKFNLSKHPFKLEDTSLVSVNAYYIRINEEQEWKNYKMIKTVYSYSYMRFYPDGRMFCSFQYLSQPNKKELQDTTYGKFGRYIIENGKLKVELYQDKHDGYAFLYAYPVSGGIQFYKSSSRGWLFRNTTRTKEGGYYQRFNF